jgi:CheY-like chemotaxis protein/HPt (histidine-containing phosphotransfer) domain-containing protein
MIDQLRARFRTRFIDTARARVRCCLELLGQAEGAGSLEQEFHALAGEAAMLGLTEISEAARSGEQAARQWGTGDIAGKALCARAVRTLSRAVEAFAAEPEEADTPVPGAPLTVPTAAHRGATIASDAGARSLTEYRVLVIDDSVLSGEHITDALNDAGIKAELASDQPGALARLQALEPHLVLSDVHMPGIDLAELCRELRAAASGSILLILLSGMGENALAVRAGEVGADGYLSKQRGVAHVVERLKLILQESHR